MAAFEGKTVIVTGGASGIGAAIVHRLDELGAAILVADRDRRHGMRIASAARNARFVETDVTDEQSVRMMVEAALDMTGRLDGAVNCAGIAQRMKPVFELDADEWDRCHAVNLRGSFLCLKYQVRAMIAGGGGSVVAIASTSAITATPNAAEYAASKAGVCGLVRGAALDCIAHGVRVNAVLPGATWTPMAEKAMAGDPMLDAVAKAIPIQRFARPEEVAAGVVWLLSEEASYVSGASLVIDGAMTIM